MRSQKNDLSHSKNTEKSEAEYCSEGKHIDWKQLNMAFHVPQSQAGADTDGKATTVLQIFHKGMYGGHTVLNESN